MGLYSIRVPDVGEGVAEAELVEWLVEVGQEIAEDDILAAVMTDKATVEIPTSRAGRVVRLGASVGDTVAIGSELVRLEVQGEGNVSDDAPKPVAAASPEPSAAAEAAPEPAVQAAPPAESRRTASAPRTPQREAPAEPPPAHRAGKPLASPSVRQRALDAGVDLRLVHGTGPAGRVTHDDLDAYRSDAAPARGRVAQTAVTETKVVGLRRKIAERMTLAYRDIPHITIVEEVDVTALEDLRAALNTEHAADRGKLTILPFLMRALVDACRRQPALNAHFDAEAGVVTQHAGVHVGIATQTDAGLMVPVVRHVESLGLWDCADAVGRLSAAAREGRASREELSGSTITITSLGPLGALATTPIINHPEVAIVGVNRMAVRPHWDGTRFVPRKMMNLSSSFDHRVIDGWDAAVFVQRLKTLLETPALLFVEA
ncbi:branched-chain alpha-keto acid dehydrogenase subunit E2 [Acuticoccus sediminis]|uniref:Dihydrolipoamide acetyltransferase component of pyruvate dehydrogenase complex n=1 Tax=Acuticoccus sediminis TaxID=2184697 RepID=A0A8B2NX80_9HYPH|nr:dihydrolipoamide acetyltransferase family protein [Acuticoccus sediminis]RAI02413.1 branched-chain alpha-keto acid dehydrogenase subunit E2 [Acuticoccus sediminis]